jgi:DNA-binding NarL/FixJ family response regulator
LSDKRRCLIIDEHPTVRLGIRRVLGNGFESDEACHGGEALEVLTSFGEFDVAIVELGVPFAPKAPAGIAAIRTLRKSKPGLGIVAHDRRPARHSASQALDAGASAYVAKSSPADSLLAAVNAACEHERYVDPATNGNGGANLTRRQRETLQHFADGRSTSEVAERLGVTTETVRTHTKAALARLEARDRAHAVAIGLRSSLIE